MTSIKLTVTGAEAQASVTGTLTSGMVGIPVTIKYDGAWDGLTKNLLCRCSVRISDSGEIRSILNVGETATVAHEVMQSNMHLHLGIEGFSADGKLVIPTVWAYCGKIEYGANTCDDPSTDPALPVWNQLQIEMEQTKEYVLTPEQAVNIQTYAQTAAQAAQEAKQAAEEARQTVESGLYYIPSVSQPTDTTLKFEFKPSVSGSPIPKPVTVELPVGEGSGEGIALLDIEPGEAFYLVTGDGAVGTILLSATSLTITEGESATFTVRLDSAPGEAQAVRLISNHEDISLTPSLLTFTPENYGTAQEVTVTIAADTDAANESGFITAMSSGAGYAEISVAILDSEADAERTKYTYVFNINSTTAADKTLTLVSNPNGDGVTDWGDGTVDSLLTHTYAEDGEYTVVTDNTLVINEGSARSASQLALIRVESWSDALYVHTDGSHNAYRLFYECINLASCADIPNGYTALTDTFRNTKALKTAPAISGTVTAMENAFWSSGITSPPVIPTSVTILTNAFNYCTAMTAAPYLHAGVTNAKSMCRNCTALTETREPWTISYEGSINADGCFTNCSKLDLSTVPTAWGGTLEVS